MTCHEKGAGEVDVVQCPRPEGCGFRVPFAQRTAGPTFGRDVTQRRITQRRITMFHLFRLR